jgi:hypothetical protein
MLDIYGKPIDISDPPLTRHELGQAADYLAGLAPMAVAPPIVRVPPPFPLSAYLIMKRAE